MRSIFGNQRLIVDHLIHNSLEDDSLDALSKLECRLGLFDGRGRGIHRGNDRNTSISRQRGLKDLSELRISVGNVRSVK